MLADLLKVVFLLVGMLGAGEAVTPISTGRNQLTFWDGITPVLLGNSEILPPKR
jgi:hypothetical protein